MDFNINELEKNLSIYHKILLDPEGMTTVSERYFPETIADKLLILLTKPHCFANKNIVTEVIAKETVEELTSLYWTYEFSDHFFVLTKEFTAAATIFNFTESGILSCEEAWKAFLY